LNRLRAARLKTFAKNTAVARRDEDDELLVEHFGRNAQQTMGIEEPLPHAASDNRAKSRKVGARAVIRSVKDKIRGHVFSRPGEFAIGSPDLNSTRSPGGMTIWLFGFNKFRIDVTFCPPNGLEG